MVMTVIEIVILGMFHHGTLYNWCISMWHIVFVSVYSGARGMSCLHRDRILQSEAGSDLLLKPEVKRENSQTNKESRGTPVCQSSGNNSCSSEEERAAVNNLD